MVSEKLIHQLMKHVPVLLFSFVGRCLFNHWDILGLVENYQVDPKMSQDCMKQIKLTVISWFSVGGTHDSTRSRWWFLSPAAKAQGQSQQC